LRNQNQPGKQPGGDGRRDVRIAVTLPSVPTEGNALWKENPVDGLVGRCEWSSVCIDSPRRKGSVGTTLDSRLTLFVID